MRLSPEENERFYRVWMALLHYVNEQRRLLPSFPAAVGEQPVDPGDVAVLRDALWADDALRDRFIADNPAGLDPAGLELVASWRNRVAGRFYIERYLKKHTVFLSDTTPVHAYGVLGLVSPIEDIARPYPPVLVETVLLPFDGRIIYDSLLRPYNLYFGSGIRADLKEAYRNAQEREGLITRLPAVSEDPDEARAEIGVRTARVLAAFRKEVARGGLSPKMIDEHTGVIDHFARAYLLAQDPPRAILDLTLADLESYLATHPRANRVSFRRFVRFLRDTGRMDYGRATQLGDYLKDA